MKSEFAPTCTDFCHGIKQDKTIIFYALLIYICKREIYVLLASFGGEILMKTDNFTHAIRNSEHITTMKTILRSLQWRNISMAWSVDNLVLMCLQGLGICDIFFINY